MRTPMNQSNECNQQTLSYIHQLLAPNQFYKPNRYSPHYKKLNNTYGEILTQTLSTGSRNP